MLELNSLGVLNCIILNTIDFCNRFTRLLEIIAGSCNPRNVDTIEIYNKGISNRIMYSTFNCGIGFILSVPKQDVKYIISRIKTAGIIGEVTGGNGVVQIESAFNKRIIKL